MLNTSYTSNDINIDVNSNPNLNDWPSTKVKRIVNLFIAALNDENNPPTWPSFHTSTLISGEEREGIKTILTKEVVESLRNDKEAGSCYRVGRGKHNIVWGHHNYPNIVFKIMKLEDATKQELVAKKALETAREMKQSWVQIPRATSIEVDTIAVYVEERLPLNLNLVEHQEFWVRVITHYQSSSSPLFRQNLTTLIQQIQNLIEKVGFWDVGYHNLPEIRTDGIGVCAVDFENVDLDGQNRIEGIERLATLFPVSPLVDGLSTKYEENIPEIYKKELKRYEETMNMYKQWQLNINLPLPSQESIKRQFELKLQTKQAELLARQTAILCYDERGYKGHEPLPKINIKDLSELTESERILAQELAKKIASKDDDKKVSLIEKRYIYWQPGCLGHSAAYYTRDAFLKMLKTLQDKGIVISWHDDYPYYQEDPIRDPKMVSYTIYF